jgi:hypothetical protein
MNLCVDRKRLNESAAGKIHEISSHPNNQVGILWMMIAMILSPYGRFLFHCAHGRVFPILRGEFNQRAEVISERQQKYNLNIWSKFEVDYPNDPRMIMILLSGSWMSQSVISTETLTFEPRCHSLFQYDFEWHCYSGHGYRRSFNWSYSRGESRPKLIAA